ncbi:MAG: tRNA (adenosine(37)-N6)-threonylcarbamoyltransferase complex transferase subunit TsaD [bacterium]|nr:tRNA (adenosine(37)-N6)-threonylcarbamoyltransferase complex transferase subunit TsaD [bacterium]
MKVIGIETSCDDTSVALFDTEQGVIQNLVSSQVELHNNFGGVVPELASRAHLVNLMPLIDELMNRSETSLDDIDGVAVTAGPGLIGALLVGLSTAKAICWARDIPMIGVHHIEGHILANELTEPMQFPAMVLVVSGGHSEVIFMPEIGVYERLGGTLDDAAGEAFDKSAKLIGLPYPGGPIIDKLANDGTPGAFQFPRPLQKDPRIVFSFSGLKTAVRVAVDKLERPISDQQKADICYELREAIADSLTQRLFQAAHEHNVKAVYLAGGVSANSKLRSKTAEMAQQYGYHFLPPKMAYCTDNAAMIACAGAARLDAGHTDNLDLDSFARRPISSWK